MTRFLLNHQMLLCVYFYHFVFFHITKCYNLKLYCRIGRLDGLMVFHQSFVTKKPVNVVACVELCSSYAIASALHSTVLYDLLTMWIIISSQKPIHYYYYNQKNQFAWKAGAVNLRTAAQSTQPSHSEAQCKHAASAFLLWFNCTLLTSQLTSSTLVSKTM